MFVADVFVSLLQGHAGFVRGRTETEVKVPGFTGCTYVAKLHFFFLLCVYFTSLGQDTYR
jgi:hypothetical protein